MEWDDLHYLRRQQAGGDSKRATTRTANQGKNTMATSSSTHNAPIHNGVERVIEGASAIKSAIREAVSGKRLPSYMVGLTIMAAVTLTARALDEAQIGFVTELLTLSAVALFAFVFLSSAVSTATRKIQLWIADTTEAWCRVQVEERLWSQAAQDPRVLNDILWAQRRDEQCLVTEHRAPTHPTQREVLAERRTPSPVFTKYY
jgi:hypothetical protein